MKKLEIGTLWIRMSTQILDSLKLTEMVKSVCDHSSHGTLKLPVCQEWIKGINFFYMVIQIKESLKLIQ